MTTTTLPRRLVICVDGTWCKPDGPGIGYNNLTNVFQVFLSVKEGECYDPVSKKTFWQEKIYKQGIGSAEDIWSFDRWKAAIYGTGFEDYIRECYQECCRLQGPDDEVWLYGFSRGAYVVRAVAGLLHHVTAIKKTTPEPEFRKVYKKALDIYRLQLKYPERATKRREFYETHTVRGPKVQFVGVFDTVKAVQDGDLYDISLNLSTHHLRQALALHEDRKPMEPETIFPLNRQKPDALAPSHSFVQAWFAGAHIDMGGSAPKAGLSLFPLQWMLSESLSKGLCLGFASQYDGRSKVDNPLHLVFPKTDAQGRGIGSWSSSSVNGIISEMHDLRGVHDLAVHKHRYDILVNNKAHSRLWPRKTRKPFDDVENLDGFCSFAPQGTIIHPSVYMLLDTSASVAFDTQKLDLQLLIENKREAMMGVIDHKITQGFWTDREVLSHIEMPPIRILVCGNTGVGKSTLINKVFGVKTGEEVTSTSDRTRGVHNVRKEIVYQNRPDLVLHDSGGFEAASEEEFGKIEEFLQERSAAGSLDQRLHMIWFCLPLNDPRPKQKATERLFDAISKFAQDIPVVIVATKKDEFTDQKSSKYRRDVRQQGQRPTDEEVEQFAETQVLERIDLIANEMRELPGGRSDACVAVSSDDETTVRDLTETAAQCFSDEKVRLLYVRAQTSSVELKVSSAMQEVMRTYKQIIGTATGAAFVPGATTTNRYASAIAVSTKILGIFGLPTVHANTAMQVVRANVWEDLGNHFALVWAEGVQTFGWLLTVVNLGIPFFLPATLINMPIVIPATTRLFLMLSADLILILARSFKDARDRQVSQPREHDLLTAARAYRRYAVDVHKRVGKMVPRRNMIKSYQSGRIGREFRDVVDEFREKMAGDLDEEQSFRKYSMETEDSDADFCTSEELEELKRFEAKARALQDGNGSLT